MAKRKKKLKLPKGVLELKWSVKKYAKKNGIKLKAKGMSKKERKRTEKKVLKEYAIASINNLDKAVKILSENPNAINGGKKDAAKITKLKEAVDNIIINDEAMLRIAKLYMKRPKEYSNLIFLPYMISNTIDYYNQENLSEDEKKDGERLNKEKLLQFCERILKSQIKHHQKSGLPDIVAFDLATVIPTTKLLANRQWYKQLIRKLYDIAALSTIDLPVALESVRTIDGKKKNYIKKHDFLVGFFSEFMLTKSSNKIHTYVDNQKELHDDLIDGMLEFLDSLKEKQLRDILKAYIKRRKSAENYKNDGKRVVKFIDHASSNSKYTKLKSVIQDLISENSGNEIYLS